MIGRYFIETDPIFPRANESVTQLFFGKKIIQSPVTKNLNELPSRLGIIPRNVDGEEN